MVLRLVTNTSESMILHARDIGPIRIILFPTLNSAALIPLEWLIVL